MGCLSAAFEVNAPFWALLRRVTTSSQTVFGSVMASTAICEESHADEGILQLFDSLGIAGIDALHEEVPKEGVQGNDDG